MLFSTPAEIGGGYQEEEREEYSEIKSDVLQVQVSPKKEAVD